MLLKKDLIERLHNSKIQYKLHEHQALHTVKESEQKRGQIEGAHTKNLFLKNKKNEFFLFSCHENRNIDLKTIGKSLKLGNISFAKEKYLIQYLGVKPGSVTPFGLLNDTENIINFYLDEFLLNFNKINFHPLVNTSTITIELKKFINFLVENKKKVNIFNFKTYSLIK